MYLIPDAKTFPFSGVTFYFYQIRVCCEFCTMCTFYEGKQKQWYSQENGCNKKNKLDEKEFIGKLLRKSLEWILCVLRQSTFGTQQIDVQCTRWYIVHCTPDKCFTCSFFRMPKIKAVNWCMTFFIVSRFFGIGAIHISYSRVSQQWQ